MTNIKKYLKSLFLFILIIPVMFLLSACGGESAYDIAVKNGFVGTEAEWLESLKGANGTDGKNGEDGTNGVDGKDATSVSLEEMYEFAKSQGFEGDYLAFLKSLSGENTNNSSEIISKCSSSVLLVSNLNTSGSGVLYTYNDDSAYIITNRHVISSPNAAIYVSFYFGQSEYNSTDRDQTIASTMQRIPAVFVGGSKTYDIAVLKVEDATKLKEYNLQEVTFSNHKLGETCYAIGNNAGQGLAATRGIVSKDFEIVTASVAGTSTSLRVLRHDAYIGGGNSGGGLFDKNGNLIGITNGGLGSGTELRNYAIPSSIAKAVSDNIIENVEKRNAEAGRIFDLEIETKALSTSVSFNKEYSSIEVSEVVAVHSANLSVNWKIESSTNHEITDILQEDDILKSINISGKVYNITRSYELKEYMLTARVGDTVVLTLERGSDSYQILLKLTSSNASELV